MTAVLSLRGVTLRHGPATVLDGIDWEVRAGERWVVLGPNGAGKTSLLRIAGLWLHPSAGEVHVLGERLGRTDVRAARARVGFASAALASLLHDRVTARDAVMSAKHGALETWWHHYEAADRARAEELLDRVGCAHLADRRFGTLSSGERQRVQLARTLMAEPDLVLLDEPMAGLDLGGREDLVARLTGLAADPATPAAVLVTHHTDEIPPGFTHVLLLRGGRVVAAGPVGSCLTEANLSTTFGLPLRLERHDGRWLAWARGPADDPRDGQPDAATA